MKCRFCSYQTTSMSKLDAHICAHVELLQEAIKSYLHNIERQADCGCCDNNAANAKELAAALTAEPGVV